MHTGVEDCCVCNMWGADQVASTSMQELKRKITGQAGSGGSGPPR